MFPSWAGEPRTPGSLFPSHGCTLTHRGLGGSLGAGVGAGREAGLRSVRWGWSQSHLRWRQRPPRVARGSPSGEPRQGPARNRRCSWPRAPNGPLPAGLRAGSRASPRPAFQTSQRPRGTGLGSIVPDQTRAPRSAAGTRLGPGLRGPSLPQDSSEEGRARRGPWRDRTRRTGQSGVSRGGRRGLGSSAGTRSLGTQAKSRGGDGQGSGFCRRSQCPVRVGSPGGSTFLFWGLGQGGAHTSYGQTYVSSKRS